MTGSSPPPQPMFSLVLAYSTSILKHCEYPKTKTTGRVIQVILRLGLLCLHSRCQISREVAQGGSKALRHTHLDDPGTANTVCSTYRNKNFRVLNLRSMSAFQDFFFALDWHSKSVCSKYTYEDFHAFKDNGSKSGNMSEGAWARLGAPKPLQ